MSVRSDKDRFSLPWTGPAVIAAMLAVSAIISGCAGTARGVNTSVYTQSASYKPVVQNPSTTQETSQAPAQVIIRYPAMIHAHAENLYVSSYAINAIGGDVPFTEHAKPQTSRLAQSVIEKSSYYAMSLYNELKKSLPEASVLLSPHIVAWDKDRGLHSRPILATEQIPSVLTIDFNIYSFPDVNELMNEPPVTFGDLVTPLIVVKSSRWTRPGLGGLLIASSPLTGPAWRQSQKAVDEHFTSRLEGTPGSGEASLDFIAFLGERRAPASGLPTKQTGNGNPDMVAVEQYSLEKIRMDGFVVEALSRDSTVDPFARGFVEGASARIVELLDSIDHDRATFFSRQAAIERFDPELARVFFIQSTDESVRARLQLAEALIGAEREFLAAQSDSIYAGTYAGNYGVKMRKIIAAEYRMLEERRELARKQNMATAVAVVALAGAVYGAVASTAASTAAVTAVSGAALAGSAWALHSSLQTRTESEEVNKYFLARMAPAFDRQMAVQMEWLESKELITARGFAEFRNKTLSLYQSRVRSMNVSATERCRFSHPGFAGDGRWYGRCDKGEAVGRGYGMIRNPGGDTLEYVGETIAGQASGTGGMIIQRSGQPGALYYEGQFRKGLPDGDVRVERPGSTPQLRRYVAGEDVGRGNATGLQSLSFATGPDAVGLLNP